MNERLYNLMDWAEIEAVTYAETDNPHSLLGAQVTDEGIRQFCRVSVRLSPPSLAG